MPDLACNAALNMIEQLDHVNDEWRKKIDFETRIGIGINSGSAHVGNTGSVRKFKYGPLGPSVNLASRIQGATKYLGVPILITGDTKEALAKSFSIRRHHTHSGRKH